MAINDKTRGEILHHNINIETAKISALSSGKTDKYELLADEEILPPNQRRLIEKAKFASGPLGKAFEKQTKTIEEQRKKQFEALEFLDPENNQKLKSIEELFLNEMRNVEIN